MSDVHNNQFQTYLQPESSNIMQHVGRCFWEGIHWIAAVYPDEPTEEHKYWSHMYLHSYARLIPCPDCRQHWLNLLTSGLPPRNNSREDFFLWSVEAHNMVNQRLGKPIMSEAEALSKYNLWYAQCPAEPAAPCPTAQENAAIKRSVYWLVFAMVVLGILLAVLGYVVGKRSAST